MTTMIGVANSLPAPMADTPRWRQRALDLFKAACNSGALSRSEIAGADPENHQAHGRLRALRWIAFGFACVLIVYSVAIFAIMPGIRMGKVVGLAAAAILYLIAALTDRTSRLVPAAWAVVAVAILGGAAASVPNGGIAGSVAPIIIIAPFAAGYFLGARAVLAATFATVAAFIFLYWAGSAGLVTPTPYPPEATKLQALFLLSMATVLGAIAVYAFAREATAREAELEHTNQVLNRERDLLEVRVLERTAALEAASQRAEAASKAKTQFLATMSHELRTPLSSIKSYAELLREGAEEESRNADIDDLDVILGASDHLLGLISEVLNMSKVEAGKMELDISGFDLGQFVEALTRSVCPIVEKNANSFCVAADPDLGEVRTDKVKLNQCLLNLLSNAAKFTKQGTVTLSIAAFERGNGPWIAFAVSDTGIGMSPDQLSKLFKPFSQADASTTRQYGGTGLGLSISKAFAELLGGSLEVESAKGKGTTFRLLIPAKLQAQERAKDEPIQSNADIKKGVAA